MLECRCSVAVLGAGQFAFFHFQLTVVRIYASICWLRVSKRQTQVFFKQLRILSGIVFWVSCASTLASHDPIVACRDLLSSWEDISPDKFVSSCFAHRNLQVFIRYSFLTFFLPRSS